MSEKLRAWKREDSILLYDQSSEDSQPEVTVVGSLDVFSDVYRRSETLNKEVIYFLLFMQYIEGVSPLQLANAYIQVLQVAEKYKEGRDSDKTHFLLLKDVDNVSEELIEELKEAEKLAESIKNNTNISILEKTDKEMDALSAVHSIEMVSQSLLPQAILILSTHEGSAAAAAYFGNKMVLKRDATLQTGIRSITVQEDNIKSRRRRIENLDQVGPVLGKILGYDPIVFED